MNRSTLVKLLTIFAALSLLSAACGGGDNTSGEGDTASTDDGSTSTESDGSDTTANGDNGDNGDSASSGGRVSTYIGQPESLTPINNTESEGAAVIAALFTGLIEYDIDTNEPVMANAASIETDDNTVYTVTLNDGWTFHDGTPVTAESYVKAWNYAAYGPNAQSTAGFFAPIAGNEDVQCGTTTDADGETVADCEGSPPAAEEMSGLVVDSDTQFTVTLNQAEPFFVTRLGYNAYVPLPEAFYSDPDGYNRAPIGNGPFMMNGEWEDDQQILTDAFPDYQGTKAQVEGIEFRIYADVATAVTDLQAGNLDIVDLVPPEQWAGVTSSVKNTGQTASSSINYIGFPTYAPPFDDPEMRAALSMAIDREAIVKGIFDGQRQAAYNILAPVIPGYTDTVCDNWNYDPEAAKAKFEAAGGVGAIGDKLEVWFNEGAEHDRWMDAVITAWDQNLGIPADSVTFQQLPFAEYLQIADGKEFTGPFRLGWGMDYPHPQNYLEILLEITPADGGNNATFWKDDAYSAKVDEALAVADVEESLPVWQEAAKIACEAAPVAPMFYGNNSFAWNDPVGGVTVNAFGHLDYTALTK